MGVALVFATMRLDVHRIVWQVPDVQRLFVVKRVVSSLLGVLMFMTMAFFPKARSARNILLHGWLLTVLFIAETGGVFGTNFGVATALISALFMTAQLGCYVVWAVALRPPYARTNPSAEAMARPEQ